MSKVKVGEAQSAYKRLSTIREDFLDRGRDAAALTIPSLLPEDESDDFKGQDLPEPYSSLGARAVNNLSSKLLLSLLPVGATKFFRMAIDEGALEDPELLSDQRTEIEETLASIEDLVIGEIEAVGLRVQVHDALRQTITAGNALLHVPARRQARVFRLDSYVVERDPRGNLLLVITKQRVSPDVLPEKIRSGIKAKKDGVPGAPTTVNVYTVLQRMSDKWFEWQEIDGKQAGRRVEHDLDRNPYMPLRMMVVSGESYGRGLVEQYMGDLRALNVLSRALQEGAAMAAKVLMLVNPDGVTRIRRLTKAHNGDFVPGREADVTALQLQKQADFSVVLQQINDLKRELGFAFLLNSTIQRSGERVTAEEIRLMSQELDQSLGGTFSLLSAELQLPLVRIILGNLQDVGRAPPLPDEVRPVIVTGLDAIGRGKDVQQLQDFLSTAVQSIGPQVVQFINIEVYLQQLAVGLGIDTEELIKTQEQMAQEAQQAQQQEMLQSVAPTIAGNITPEQMEAAGEQFGGAGGAAVPPAA